jgi:hypothetical protein
MILCARLGRVVGGGEHRTVSKQAGAQVALIIIYARGKKLKY